jgi:hypothetical protein
LINICKQTTTILADEQNMDLRNILNILTENEEEVKPNLPEAMQGNKISDLRKTNAKFNQKGAKSTLQPMVDAFEVKSLAEFVKDAGFTPTFFDVNKGDGKAVNEYFTGLPPVIDPCEECDGHGVILQGWRDPIRICDECLGWGELKDGEPKESRINPRIFDEVTKMNNAKAEKFGLDIEEGLGSDDADLADRMFRSTGPKGSDDEGPNARELRLLGKDGKEPAIKYKDSTEADLADRMFRSKGPKGPDRELADKDEGPNARELRLIKQLSGQTKIDEDELDEVLDAPTRSASNKELQDYLSRTVDKKKLKTDKYKMPYIHRSNIVNKYKKDDDKEPKDDNILATDKQVPIVDPNGQQYDLEKLAADITERPKRILSQNEKMTHGDGTETVFFNIGIPALTGLGYDETKKEFVIINTCPGAGECKTFCYALKGGYVQWSPVSLGQTRKLNFLYNDPSGFFDKLNTEIDLENNKSLVKDDPNVSLAVRWHDAGDFFSDEYLDLSYKLADMHPNVRFYAYTKRADVSGATTDRPPNFLIRFSMGANKSEEKKIDFATTLHAITVPKELFNDLLMKSGSKLIKDAEGGWQWDSPEALDQFKERMMIKYPAIKPNTLITYDEMMKQPLGTGSAFGSRNITPKWNVMVKPGDGDDAANRSDVLGVYNLEH